MSSSEQDSVGQREVAYRLFAAEFEDSTLSYSESDEERAPNYVVTPTGAQVNRLFVVGVLTEVEQVGENILRGRVVDPTGAFVIYAGQYQPDEQAFLERTNTPTFVAVTGKARTFQPEDSEQVYTSIRPESINEVDSDTRDRWTLQATVQTLDRIARVGTALSTGGSGDAMKEALRERGADQRQATSTVLALEHYGTTPTYLHALRELALDAARVVAGERDEVTELTAVPDEAGDIAATALTDTAVDDVPQTAVSDVSEGTTHAGDSTETESLAETESSSTETPEMESAVEEESDDGAVEDLGDFDPEEFELGAETREEIESEFGTEFQTGSEVDEPGEADIETPPSDFDDELGRDEHVTEDEESIESTEPDDEPSESPETDDEPSESAAVDDDSDEVTEADDEPEDLQAAAVELMSELDDGSGADRQALLDTMAERYGVDESDTESAIQDALMAGECYEPDDSTLKPI